MMEYCLYLATTVSMTFCFVINFVYNDNSLADPRGGLANGQPVRAGDPSSFYGGI